MSTLITGQRWVLQRAAGPSRIMAASVSALPGRPLATAPRLATPLSTSATRLKKSKAAQVRKVAAEHGGVDEADMSRVVAKTRERMGKTAEWAKMVVFDAVERGRGRVTPALLDPVKVHVPDQPGNVTLNSVASITVKGNTLIVEVWDRDATKHVESALHKANIPGLSIQRDADLIRIPVSKPTGEIRAALRKSIHDTLETAKTQIRVARTEGMKALGGRGEDGTDDVQELANEYGGLIDKLEASAKRELDK